MKLRKNKPNYRLPKSIGQVLNVWLDETMRGGSAMVVQQREYVGLKGQLVLDKSTGRPMQIGFDSHGKNFAVWPTPDKSYDLVIRYYPPAEEM